MSTPLLDGIRGGKREGKSAWMCRLQQTKDKYRQRDGGSCDGVAALQGGGAKNIEGWSHHDVTCRFVKNPKYCIFGRVGPLYISEA